MGVGGQKQTPCNQAQPDLSLARCHSHSHHYHSAEHSIMPEDAAPHPRTRIPNRPKLRKAYINGPLWAVFLETLDQDQDKGKVYPPG